MSRQPSSNGRHRRPVTHRLRNRALTVGVTTAMITTGLLATAPKARALDSHCEGQPNGQIVCHFDIPGHVVFQAPSGFSVADAILQGAAGGSGEASGGGTGGAGGAGGTTTGMLNLPSSNGPTLDVYVGDEGQAATDAHADCDAGSSGGESDGIHGQGGDSGSVDGGTCGGGGGGGTFIMLPGERPDETNHFPLAAAGGGGGGGTDSTNPGGDGGTPAGTGDTGTFGGKPGTQTDGGDGGVFVPDPGSTNGNGRDGKRGFGGDGGNGGFAGCNTTVAGCETSGGGGGGGFYGGGGGAAGFGGGGGSGCMNCADLATDYRTTAIPGAPGSNAPGPVFHMAQVGSILLTFGNGMSPPGGRPIDHHHSSGNNDPNPNTNPARTTARTTTATCEPRLGFCRVGPIVGPDSVFNVTASGGTHNAVLYGTLQGGARPRCPGYAGMNADWLAFGFQQPLAGSTWHKESTLTTRHKLTRAAALALSQQMQICFEAPYSFPTRPGYELGGQNKTFDGVLPDCGGGNHLCVAARKVLQRKGGWVVRLTFRVPANAQDPKALG
jgi:hypothetical protein